MEQFYNILKESLNEEMGWMIDHIYVYLDYDEDKIELLLNDYDPEHNRYIQ